MKNSPVVENNFLFLDVEQAISYLNERILRYKQRNYLMIVLSEEALSAGNQIASASGLSVALSLVSESRPTRRPTNEIPFDFNIVKGSGRDLPQDFVVHEERNLKAKMIAWYERIYKETSSRHPGNALILVDALTNDGFEFRQREDSLDQSENRMAEPDSNHRAPVRVARRFIYLHSIHKDGDGINMIIEQKSPIPSFKGPESTIPVTRGPARIAGGELGEAGGRCTTPKLR